MDPMSARNSNPSNLGRRSPSTSSVYAKEAGMGLIAMTPIGTWGTLIFDHFLLLLQGGWNEDYQNGGDVKSYLDWVLYTMLHNIP